MENREVSYKIIEHIGVLKAFNSGWQKEANIVQGNSGQPKYDIRDWDMNHEHMTRGITLFPEEMDKLVELVSKRKTK